jgi:glutamate-1-semialdehyde 2,1-aminomutase
LDALASASTQVDVIISSSVAPSYLIDDRRIRRIQDQRGNRPLVIVDLAVPRNVDPRVAAVHGVQLFNIDDLRKVAEANLETRRAELPAAQRIIADEVSRTRSQLANSGAEPVEARETSRSEELAIQAAQLIPGGVNSPVRAYRAVGGTPRHIARADGPWIWDVDGNRYLDLVCSWGPLILGHRPPTVTEALRRQLTRGWSYGAPTEAELMLAREVSNRMPSIGMLRLVNSGTEAVMSAVRLARAATGRTKLIKFAGGYHGHADAVLVNAGSGVATLGLPGTNGVTLGAAGDTIVARYNSLADVETAFGRWPEQIAAVIVEPVAGNMGVVPPAAEFLEGLRRITARDGALLIFDEVITGFRLARGGAQELFGISPDLTCLGKVIGGGLPIGAYGGRRELMQLVAPAGPVYQAGTLSGNPLAVAAGLATIRMLDDEAYKRLETLGSRAVAIIRRAAGAAGQPVTINRAGSMFTVFFSEQPVTDYSAAQQADGAAFAAWFHAMLRRGIALPPAQLEACFVSTAHGEGPMEQLDYAASAAFQETAARFGGRRVAGRRTDRSGEPI